MTTSFELGHRWWLDYQKERENFLRIRRQEGHIGPPQANLKNNRCIYATGGSRSPRLYRYEDGDRYLNNYRNAAIAGFQSGYEVMADPTTQDPLIGQDPVHALLVGIDTSANAPRLSPDSLIVNDQAIEIAKGIMVEGGYQQTYLTRTQQAKEALASSGEDKYSRRTSPVREFSFNKNNNNHPEIVKFGNVSTNNKFEQRVRIFDPRKTAESTFEPIVAASQVRINVMNNSSFITSGKLVRSREWSKAFSTVHYGYTYEYHNFSYPKPWIMTRNVSQIEDGISSVAKLNPEYNFFNKKYEDDAEEFFEDDEPFKDILGRRYDARASRTNYWIGERTKILQSSETQEKKNQLPFYIELSLPTQKQGPLLKAIKKFGFEESLLRYIANFDRVHDVTLIKKTGFLIPGQGGEVAVSPTRYSEAVKRGAGINRREGRTVRALEFYGGDKSLFKTYYDGVVSGRLQNDYVPCGTYRDRLMLMGLQTRIEQILGDRRNRITYVDTLPSQTYGYTHDEEVATPDLDQAPCKTETLYYEIIKTPTDRSIDSQKFFLSNPEDDVLNFIDTQVDLNRDFSYEVNAMVAVYGIAYQYTLPNRNLSNDFWYSEQIGDRRYRFPITRPSTGIFVDTDRDVSQERSQWPLLDVFVHYIPSVKIFKIPVAYSQTPSLQKPALRSDGISFDSVRIIDRPPVAPGVTFVPYRGINNEILINFSDNVESLGVGTRGVRYYAFSDEEQAQFETIHNNQKLYENNKLLPGRIEFRGEGDSESIEVYRTTEKPMRGLEDTFEQKDRQPYLAFLNQEGGLEPHKIIDLKSKTSCKDEIKPNVTYYYTFRTRDRHGKISNPSPIYSVELVDEEGKIYALINTYEPQKPKRVKPKNQNLVKFLEIGPSPLSSQVFLKDDDRTDQVGLVSGDDNVIGKTFKVRIKSKDTGRLVDLNIRFTENREVDEELVPPPAAEQEVGVCEDVEEE